ncbi:MAG: ABC transporter ATP-binding protein [Chitinispirillaceae bacterium]
MIEPVIETHNLCKSYTLGKTEVPVLDNINFTVHKGNYTAIMGQSGAGKSTLLNILGCLDSPSSGEYLIRNTPVSSLNASSLAQIRNAQIGFVFQNFNLLPKLDLAANVELPLIYANVPGSKRKKNVEQVLKRLGIWDRRHHRPNEISGGQKQRVAIARALVKNPAIILADEPTGNLDSHTTSEILSVFDELHREGNTIVVITHEVDVAARAQQTIRLADGRIVS